MNAIKIPIALPNFGFTKSVNQPDNVPGFPEILFDEAISTNANTISIITAPITTHAINAVVAEPAALITSSFLTKIPEPITTPTINANNENNPYFLSCVLFDISFPLLIFIIQYKKIAKWLFFIF
jgi:hypothetical protein